jgi:hypothetical protein
MRGESTTPFSRTLQPNHENFPGIDFGKGLLPYLTRNGMNSLIAPGVFGHDWIAPLVRIQLDLRNERIAAPRKITHSMPDRMYVVVPIPV